MKRIVTGMSAAVSLLLASSPANAFAVPPELVIHCKQRDWQNTLIPTRQGNRAWGWRHLSAEHNIRKCSVVNAALNGSVDARSGSHWTYIAYAINRSTRKQIKIVAIVQHAQSTDDRKFKATDGYPIGVITAYCVGVNKCPDWVNQ
ncbi:hypothetical protein [Streptomyces sp. NPDC089799]|uniref:hypothetical protein n=1 Tax=Streptomyces sp. NPDC089799 TaxID=3155066 RepID=UPI003440208E